MRYLQYKGVMEREYRMSLKKIMHQLCVTENMNAVDGAKKLGIAKEVFVYWRSYFRLEDRQMLFDQTINDLMELESLYTDEAANYKADAKAAPSSSDNLEDFEGVIDGLIKYYKHIHYMSEGLSPKAAKLPLYEFSKAVIAGYKNGKLEKELRTEG